MKSPKQNVFLQEFQKTELLVVVLSILKLSKIHEGFKIRRYFRGLC